MTNPSTRQRPATRRTFRDPPDRGPAGLDKRTITACRLATIPHAP